MSKFLNLDEYAKPTKEFSLNGKNYKINNLSVGDFIKVSKMQQQIEEAGDKTTMEDLYNLSIEIILSAVPELTKEELYKLTSEQLNALAKYIQETETDKVTEEAKN